ncbi:hypothetical protein ASG57_07130 [Bradyrhizobium sp. Leaf396]|nr:hypothetical protein ASG57_07130 [Bradyrhizobium sp. Leaf396]
MLQARLDGPDRPGRDAVILWGAPTGTSHEIRLGKRGRVIPWLRQVAPAVPAAFLQGRFDRMHPHATKCIFGVESLLPRNDTAITHFSALKRQGELFH